MNSSGPISDYISAFRMRCELHELNQESIAADARAAAESAFLAAGLSDDDGKLTFEQSKMLGQKTNAGQKQGKKKRKKKRK